MPGKVKKWILLKTAKNLGTFITISSNGTVVDIHLRKLRPVKMSDGYEIKERTVKIWIMLTMKGQLFFILPQHTDILSWLDIYYHKERSKLTSEKLIDQFLNWCSAAWWQSYWKSNYYRSVLGSTTPRWSDRDRYHCLQRAPDVLKNAPSFLTHKRCFCKYSRSRWLDATTCCHLLDATRGTIIICKPK